MPGVTYDRDVERVDGRRVVIHEVIAPMPVPGGLYELRPVLSGGTITGTDTVTAMQRRVSSQATAVGINGDLFSFEDGRPSGMFMRDGVLYAPPAEARSTLGIGLDGRLRVARIGFSGTWAIGDAPRETLDQLNRPLEAGQVGLFTPAWGALTPKRRGAVELILSGFPPATPGTDLTAQVSSVERGGGTAIPSGGAVIQASGDRAARLRQIAEPGLSVVVRLALKPWWAQVQDAIGGGPALVRKGRLALPTTEAFTASQLLVRHPRSAVGQLPDGRVILLTVDGRSSRSAGVTIRQLGELLVDRGVDTAMAFDGGGSTTLAFDGSVLNEPGSGEQAVANALMVLYYGVYIPKPAHRVVSPNGDGVADEQRLTYKVVRPSTVDAELVGPGGKVAVVDSARQEPGAYSVPPELVAGLAEGSWKLVVSAVDERGLASRAERAFSVNNTLGHLSLSTTRLELRKRRPASLAIAFRTAHWADVQVTVEDARRRVVRTLLGPVNRKPGRFLLSWNGRGATGGLVAPGTYRVRVLATNRLGKVELAGSVVVERR